MLMGNTEFMNNLLRSFYTVLTAPVEVANQSQEEESEEYWVENVERVSLFASLFGSFNSRRQSFSV